VSFFGRKATALPVPKGAHAEVASAAAWFSSRAGRPASDFGGRERIHLEIWRQFCAARLGGDPSELNYFHTTAWWGEWSDWPEYVRDTLGSLSLAATNSGTRRQDRLNVGTLHLCSHYLPAQGSCLTWYDDLKSSGFDHDRGEAVERFAGDYAGKFKMTFFYFVDDSIFANGHKLLTKIEPEEALKSPDVKVRRSYVDHVIDLAMENAEWVYLDGQERFAFTPWHTNSLNGGLRG